MKNNKIYYTVSLFIILTAIILTVVFLITYNKIQRNDIEFYKSKMYVDKLECLKSAVNSVYQIIDANFQYFNEQNTNIISEGSEMTEEIVNAVNINRIIITLDNIRKLKFDTDGFVFINDYEKPYTVRINPEKPVLEGSDWEILIKKDTLINIYEYFHNAVKDGNGECVVNYEFNEEIGEANKSMFGYLKLYKEMGWIIGSTTNYYFIDKFENERVLLLKSEIINILKSSAFITFLLLLFWSVVYLGLRKKIIK